jgi:imidazolonepropionase-like amidohydrolase
MPGLIDAHSHTTAATIPVLQIISSDPNYTMLKHGKAVGELLLQGFTSVRDVGGNSFGLKRAIDEGQIPGPRIWPSGAGISQTSGHGDWRSNELPLRAGGLLAETMGSDDRDGVAEVQRRVWQFMLAPP